MCVLRWSEGSGRFPLAAVEQMRADGQALAAKVNDAYTLAKFYAADAFHPFHVGREGGEVTPGMLDEAEASGRRALDRRLRLRSAPVRRRQP